VLVGAAEATVGAVGPALIDAAAPAGRRSSWLGFFYVAAHVGAACGVILGGLVERRAGWRAAFLVAGAPGLAFAALSLLVDRRARTSRAGGLAGAAKVGDLLRSRRYAGAVAGYCLYTFAIGGFAHWAPEIVERRFHAGLARGNLALGVASLVGGVAGTALGGAIGDCLSRRGDSGRTFLRACAVASALAAPLGAAAIIAPNLTTSVGLLLACQLSLFATTAPINGALLRASPPGAEASALAVAIFFIHLFGDLWSPTVVGALADAWSLETAALLLPAALVAGAAVWWATARRAT
jgi:MFS family permease